MLSSQMPVGWLEIRLPPGSAAALADQSGLTYHLAPTNGFTMWVPPLPPVGVGVGVGVGLLLRVAVGVGVGEDVRVGDPVGLVVTPLQVTPFSVNVVGFGLLEVHEPLKPKFVFPPVAIAPL